MTDAINPQPPHPSLVACICRCSSPHEHANRAAYEASSSANAELERVKRETVKEVADLRRQVEVLSQPDPRQFEILEVVPIGNALVLKVKYETCTHRAFEGIRVLVFLKASTLDAIKWRAIDPHFSKPAVGRPANAAPPPDARFPATDDGWSDALAYAKGKAR